MDLGRKTSAFSTVARIRVPPELVDEVIDYVYDDKGTLSACSLVSRTWVARSRRYLFRTMKIALRGDRDSLSFLRFLEDTPSIRCFIEELALADDENHSPDPLDDALTIADLMSLSLIREDSRPQQIICPIHVVSRILEFLPELWNFALHDLTILCMCPSAITENHSLPKHFDIEKLTVENPSLSAEMLVRFLDLFAHVDFLDLLCGTLHSSCLPSPDLKPTRLKVYDLKWRSDLSPLLYRILRSTPTVSSLYALEAGFTNRLDMQRLAKLVRRCSNIRILDLTPFGMTLDGDDNEWMVMDFSSCHSLRTFALRHIGFSYHAGDQESIDIAVHRAELTYDILERLPPNLRHVVVGIHVLECDIGILREFHN